jgi:hypothetical protein
MDLILAARITFDPRTGAIQYGFSFEEFLVALMWGVWVVLNLWIWQKTKALGNMLMLCGSGILCLSALIRSFAAGLNYFVDFLAIGALTVGFFLSVKPLVDAQLSALKAKLHSATHKEGGGTPPPPQA